MSQKDKKWFVAKELENLPKINIADLLPIQGELKDLSKANYKKLKDSIFHRSFFAPVFTWLDPASQNRYLLDGHQRQRVILAEFPGYWQDDSGQYYWLDGKTREPMAELPTPKMKPAGKEVPYITIKGATYQEAKENLLIIDSKMGEVTKDGYDDFVADMANVADFIDTYTTYDVWKDYKEPEQKEESEKKEKAGKDTASLGMFALVVNCKDDIDQNDLFNRLIKQGYIVRKEI